MTAPLRVVIADDHAGFRDGLALLLEAGGVEVVAQASNGREALDAALAHEPDVVVMDVEMPELSGIEATRELAAVKPQIGVLMLSLFEGDETVAAAKRAGAGAYLAKGSGMSDIIGTLQAIRSSR
jgi:DNA-binding NarL/FixJ family response regulator